MKKIKGYLAFILVLCMIFALAGCSKGEGGGGGGPFGPIETKAGDETDGQTEPQTEDVEIAKHERTEGVWWIWDDEPGGETETGGGTSTPDDGKMPDQLTIEDIQKMNGDTLVIDLWRNDGYLSSLIGKFYDKKVTNVEESILAIRGIASMLGLGKGCEFFCPYISTDPQGYTYYKLQQRYGGYTLQYATMTIVVDPDGYTAGVTSSFVPNVGTASQEDKITAQEAEQIVREKFSGFDLVFYSDKTVRMAVPIEDVVYNCYVVFTDNPDSGINGFDQPYIEHYVSTDGEYLQLVPSSSFITSADDRIDCSEYFDGLETENVSYELTLGTGDTRKITVPISYSSKTGKYYMIDPSRKIAVSDYGEMCFGNTVQMITADSPQGFTDSHLFTYDNVIKVWDFYASRGLRSIDGFGTPVLVTVNYCDRQGNAISNACFWGIHQGWACIAFSNANRWGDCMDLVGHEFTHGVTREAMQGMRYRNETGAINESYSDIMGNIAEMSTGNTTGRNWLICEMSGNPIRDMGDPNRFNQPAFVGDAYYVTSVANPSFDANDYGGVHVNNSLIGHVAYLLDQAGMSLDEQYAMWIKSIELLTPNSDYEDLHGILLFSLKINGMLQEYGPVVNKAFEEEGLTRNWKVTYKETSKDGYTRVSAKCDEAIYESACQILFADQSGTIVSRMYPDSDYEFSTLLPAGSYIIQFQLYENGSASYYNYSGSGWVQDGSFGTFTVSGESAVELPGLYTGNSPTGHDDQTETQSQSQDQPQTHAPQNGKLNLVTYDGGYFSLLLPEGWTIDVGGS
ncbi:MAG: M4 family metallopeptidase, partial [Lachnospiraceae bacterium]|nr:M4 family metallopeptidase [Lachnospiraceae bacterium]